MAQQKQKTAPLIAGGYVLFPKAIACHRLMDKPPIFMKLWTWMLMKARFRNGDKLRRGQFVSTIDEMREAMAHNVGYRKERPSRDQIRAAYDFFTKASMITTAKTTRGLRITICNYSEYQSPKSYEAHTKSHNEAPDVPTR